LGKRSYGNSFVASVVAVIVLLARRGVGSSLGTRGPVVAIPPFAPPGAISLFPNSRGAPAPLLNSQGITEKQFTVIFRAMMKGNLGNQGKCWEASGSSGVWRLGKPVARKAGMARRAGGAQMIHMYTFGDNPPSGKNRSSCPASKPLSHSPDPMQAAAAIAEPARDTPHGWVVSRKYKTTRWLPLFLFGDGFAEPTTLKRRPQVGTRRRQKIQAPSTGHSLHARALRA
jgi:hypothetical protein